MKFEPLMVSRWTFRCFCLGCNHTMQSDRDEIWCDLDGPAFKAYYCTRCKMIREYNAKEAA